MHFESKGWLIELGNDWLQLLHPASFNWLTFNLLKLHFEWERYLGAVEFEVCVLGLSARVSYTYDRHTETREAINRTMEEILSDTSVVVPHPEYSQMKHDAEQWREYLKQQVR